MPKINAKKTAFRSGMTQKLAQGLRHVVLSILATPFNLLVIMMRLAWSGRRVRLASLALLVAGSLWAVFTLPYLHSYAETAHGQFLQVTARAGFKATICAPPWRLTRIRRFLRLIYKPCTGALPVCLGCAKRRLSVACPISFISGLMNMNPLLCTATVTG